ncbi:MAG: TetR/AcrR family transcriptional regulator [Oscillospiraceae bacterium]
MNEKFYDLPEEKREQMLNGALHVFAKYDYKKASMEEIAAAAGVSKALLFHYFENKRGLYLFAYSYSTDFFLREMRAMQDDSETDYFQMIVNSQRSKLAILAKHPDIMMFLIKAYYEESPEVRNDIDKSFAEVLADSSRRFLERADISRLKEGVSADKLLNIILWMSEGYMRTRTPEQLSDLEKLNEEYLEHVEMLRRHLYKPEFL